MISAKPFYSEAKRKSLTNTLVINLLRPAKRVHYSVHAGSQPASQPGEQKPVDSRDVE